MTSELTHEFFDGALVDVSDGVRAVDHLHMYLPPDLETWISQPRDPMDYFERFGVRFQPRFDASSAQEYMDNFHRVFGEDTPFFMDAAAAVSVKANAADKIRLDGKVLDDGDKITSGGAKGDIAVLTYYSADGWYASTNGWTDGGA